MDTSIITQTNKFSCIDCGAAISEKRAKRCRACNFSTRKSTPDAYHALAQEKGFLWVGTLPRNNKTKTLWQCKNGHQWMACIKTMRGTSYCPECPIVSPEEYHDLARSRGFLWIGEHVHKTRFPTEWQCSKGHRWFARYNGIKQGSGCPECDKIANHIGVDDYHSLARDRGVSWVGVFPKDSHTKTEWICANGHHWMGTYKGISKGKGCPHCRKVQADDYLALATERGFIWNGVLPQRTTYPTGWQCSFGHTWSARYSSVKEGRGCPHCSDIADRFKEEEYHALAQKRGFSWIGELPNKVGDKTKWQCSLGHQWETSYNTIAQGCGCVFCLDYENGVKASKPQRAIHEMIGGIMNYRIGRHSVDVALQLPFANVAVEYDSFYFHGSKTEKDAERVRLLIKAGWRVLSIKANNMIPTFDQIQECIFDLLAGADYTEIVMPDWGKGKAK